MESCYSAICYTFQSGFSLSSCWSNYKIDHPQVSQFRMGELFDCGMVQYVILFYNIYWFGTFWNMAFIFPFSWECHHPN